MTESQRNPPELTVSADWAAAYFARRLYAESWESVSEPDRRRALDWAASILAAAYLWDAAAHPGGVWRGEILALVCEEALWLLDRGNAEPAPGRAGVKRAAAGPISITFETGAGSDSAAAGLISPLVADLASAWARPASNGGRIASTLLG